MRAMIDISPDPLALPAPTGTRLLAVLTFGGMKRICLPSAVFTLPIPLMGIGFEVDAAATEVAGI